MQSIHEVRSNNEIRQDLPICPKCHENSLHVHSTGHYQCIYCDFERNLTEQRQMQQFGSVFAGLCLVILFIGGIAFISTPNQIIVDRAPTSNKSK